MATPATPTSAATPAVQPDPLPVNLVAPPPQTQLDVFGSDEPLWYQGTIPGSRWAQAGYAVPNLAGKNWTTNVVIADLFALVGRNLFEIMHEPDARLSRPPNVKCLLEVNQLVIRARQVLSARALPPNQARFDPTHSTPARQVFVVYPIPFFGDAVRQPALREWSTYALALLAEMAQHTDNRYAYEITTDFAGLCGQYLQRIYMLMACTFFGKTPADALKSDFTLTAADFAAYNPGQWFTSVEMTDEVPDLGWQPTSNDLRAIRGIPADQLVGLARWPTQQPVPIGGTPTAAAPVTTPPAQSTGAFIPAPGPMPPAQ